MPQMPKIRGFSNRANPGRVRGRLVNVPMANKNIGSELKELGKNLQETGRTVNAYMESRAMVDAQSWMERGKQQSIRLNENRLFDSQDSEKSMSKEESDQYYFVKDETGLTEADKAGLKAAGLKGDSFSGRMFLRGFRASNAKYYPQVLQVNEANSKLNLIQSLNQNKAETLKTVNVENLNQVIDLNKKLLAEQFLNTKEKLSLQRTFVVDATNKTVNDALEINAANLSGNLDDRLQEIDDIGTRYKKFVESRLSGHYNIQEVQKKKISIDNWIQKKKQRAVQDDNLMNKKIKEREQKSLLFLQSEGDQKYFDKSTPEGILEYARSKVFLTEDPVIDMGINQANEKTGQINPVQKEYELRKEKQNRLLYKLPIYILDGQASLSPEDMKSIPLELQDDFSEALTHDPVMSDPYLRKLFQTGNPMDKSKLKEYFHYFESDGKPNFRYKDTYSFMKGSGRVADLRSALGEGSAEQIRRGVFFVGKGIERVRNGASYSKMEKYLRGLMGKGDITYSQYNAFINQFKPDASASKNNIDPEINKSLMDGVKSLNVHIKNRIMSEQGFSVSVNPLTGKPFLVDPKGKEIQQKAFDWVNNSMTELKYSLRGKDYKEGKKIVDLWKKRVMGAINTGVLGEEADILLMSEDKLNMGYEEAVNTANQKQFLMEKSVQELKAIALDNEDTVIGNMALSILLNKRDKLREKENEQNNTKNK